MTGQATRSRGVCVLGWTVIAANVLLYFVYYFGLLSFDSSPAVRKTVFFISILAVFPYDFFMDYFTNQWIPQTVWVMMVTICAFGILLLNSFAQSIFIFLNIFQIVILGQLVLLKIHHPHFLESFFEFYFVLVVSGSYMIFLTFPEVRRQFKIELEGLKMKILFQKPLGRKVRASDVATYASLSNAYLRLERYEEAQDALEKALSIDPENADYYFRLGMIHIKQNLMAKAVGDFKQAIAHDPVHYEAYYNLGVLYVQQGCSEEAAQMFLKAIHVKPQDPQAYRDLGDAYFSLGDYEEAIAQYRQVLSLARHDAYSFYRMGCIFSEYLSHHQEAFEALREAIHIDPDMGDAQFHFGKVCIQLKRYKDAVRAFKEVIRIDEDHIQAHYYLGFVYALLKDFCSAEKQCRFLKRYDEGLAKELSLVIGHE